MSQRITSHIFHVGGAEESHSSDASVYLIADSGEAGLVDAGTGQGYRLIMDNIKSAGVNFEKIKYLFLTHCHFDHTGGAGEIRKATGCKIVCHALDSMYIEDGDSAVTAASWYGTFMKRTTVDIKVEGSEALFEIGNLKINFYHTPGHSPGSSVLTLKSDNKLVLFGQDVHGPLNETLLSNRNDYIKSLEFMLTFDADILCEGHFGVFFGKETVKDFIESYL